MDEFGFIAVDFDSAFHQKELIDLLNGYSSLPIGQGKPLGEKQGMELWKKLGARRSWVHGFLGYVNAEAVALAITMEGFSTFQGEPLLNIHDFYVADNWQGKGIGTWFLRSLINHASSAGFGKVTLEVLSGNIPAKRLYRSLGFRPYENPVGGIAEFWQCQLAQVQSHP